MVELGKITPEIAKPEEGEIREMPAPGIPNPVPPIVEIVRQDLATRLNLPLESIVCVSAEKTEWPNSGLGCPSPDAFYAQVITPGYQVMLQANGQDYIYHTNQRETFVLCEGGVPAE